jgi:hypothetical protein
VLRLYAVDDQRECVLAAAQYDRCSAFERGGLSHQGTEEEHGYACVTHPDGLRS